jgi:hypothetical protein
VYSVEGIGHILAKRKRRQGAREEGSGQIGNLTLFYWWNSMGFVDPCAEVSITPRGGDDEGDVSMLHENIKKDLG